jgi:hypothetical protein
MKTNARKFGTLMLVAASVSVLVAREASAQDDKGKRSPVLAVVGDIACQPISEPAGEAAHEACTDPKTPPPYTKSSLWQSQEATANQIAAMKPDLVALVGDLQYQVGEYTDFTHSFDLTYGGFKYIHRPAPGNHEFYNEHGQRGVAGYGYFSYYNGFQIHTDGSLAPDGTPLDGTPITKVVDDPCPVTIAGCTGPAMTAPVPQPIPRQDGQAGHFGDSGNGWYSYNVGSWHIISLNIECATQPGGCSDAGGTWFDSELDWLKRDLEKDHAQCTLAYWHQPTYSAANSLTTEGKTAQAFWQLLYDYNADVVLNGHDHLYARYRPLDPAGNPDAKRGLREFIVGTGGETLDPVSLTGTSSNAGGDNLFNTHNLEASTGNFWGVMALTLDKKGYKWDFESALPIPGVAGVYSDKGVGTCHGNNRGDNDDNDDQR